jgi:hypothetical protein
VREEAALYHTGMCQSDFNGSLHCASAGYLIAQAADGRTQSSHGGVLGGQRHSVACQKSKARHKAEGEREEEQQACEQAEKSCTTKLGSEGGV